MERRIITVEGVWNFRDAGGYRAEDGRSVKWHKILRSGELSNLTDNGIKIIKKLDVKYIFDYRTQEEYDKAPDRIIKGIEYKLLPAIEVDPAQNDAFLMHEHAKSKGTLKAFSGANNPLLHHYQNKSFYTNNPAYHRLMELLMSEDGSAFIQHCTAGKDRTGLGVALVLLTLGVDKETMIEDYLLTNICRKPFTDKILAQEGSMLQDEESIEVLRSMMEVRREYIEATLEGINSQYGNFRNYILEEYGITDTLLNKIKDKYLE